MYPNGLKIWNEREIETREYLSRCVFLLVKESLSATNRAWSFLRVECPILTPPEAVNPLYDPYKDGLALRPETTPGSYWVSREALSGNDKRWRLPLCVWQSGKSFRKEQDQPTKFCRFKEFYQQEFQCLYAPDTKNDYFSAILEPLRIGVENILKQKVRITSSKRLPGYSDETQDLETRYEGRWMEVCSISRRTDFDVPNVEIAFGLDRLVCVLTKD